MEFRQRLAYQLTKILRCSHKEARTYCLEGRILVNMVVETNQGKIVGREEEIRLDHAVIRPGIEYRYVLFNKPNGFECTSNRMVENNIYEILPLEYQDFFSLGRLDINSEGLLLLTNDGPLCRQMMTQESGIEKEYLVHTFQPITDELKEAFTNSFRLGQRDTLPARFEKLDDHSFRVVLKEGINRQIRRICAKNGNQVKQLIRIRFGSQILEGLETGEWREVEKFC